MTRSTHLALLGVLGLIALGFTLTIRPGHVWPDDFALYILHAQNLVQGRPYADTGYLYNPLNPFLSPPTYPPVYPVLLAPIYAIFGLNLTAMKVEIILLLALAAWTAAMLFRHDLPAPYLVAGAALIAANPQLWLFKERIQSDIPFMLFTVAGLLAVSEAALARSGRRRLGAILLAGLMLAVAYGTRTVAIALVGSVVVWDLLRHRRPTPLSVGVVVVFLLYRWLQDAVVGSQEAGYAVQLANERVSLLQSALFTLGLLPSNAAGYLRRLSSLWDPGTSSLVRVGLFGAISCLAVVGYAWRARRSLTAAELFVPVYLGVLAIWPAQAELRLLFPVISLYVFYSLIGLRLFATRFLAARHPYLPLGVLVAVLVSVYCVKYVTLANARPPANVLAPASMEMLAYLRDETPPEARLLARRPRALTLFTHRSAMVYHQPPATTPAATADFDAEMWQLIREARITHVVLGRPFASDATTLLPFVERYPGRFERVFANADFSVYRARS